MATAAAQQRARERAYGETFRCPGGELCLDFCNTGQGARDQRGGEWLAEYVDLVDWLEAAGALGAEQARRLARAAQAAPEAATRAWRRALALREALQRILEARVRAQTPAREDLRCFESEHARAAAFARLDWHAGHATWRLDPQTAELDAVLQPIVHSVARLLASERLARTRRCCNPSCSWLFVDDTRNRSRRWCEMASCGNLQKVRRHRARKAVKAGAARRARKT